MDTQGIRTRVKKEFANRADLTDALLAEFMGEGCDYINDRIEDFPIQQQHTTFSTVADQESYLLTGMTIDSDTDPFGDGNPGDGEVLGILQIKFTTTENKPFELRGYALEEYNMLTLENSDTTLTGYPVAYAMFDGRVYLKPIPEVAATIDVWFLRRVKRLDNSAGLSYTNTLTNLAPSLFIEASKMIGWRLFRNPEEEAASTARLDKMLERAEATALSRKYTGRVIQRKPSWAADRRLE